jgi:hypothetical protein
LDKGIGIASYLRNISPSSMSIDKTPHETWIGKKPSLAYLNFFGHDAYGHVPKERKKYVRK